MREFLDDNFRYEDPNCYDVAIQFKKTYDGTWDDPIQDFRCQEVTWYGPFRTRTEALDRVESIMKNGEALYAIIFRHGVDYLARRWSRFDGSFKDMFCIEKRDGGFITSGVSFE